MDKDTAALALARAVADHHHCRVTWRTVILRLRAYQRAAGLPVTPMPAEG